MGNMMVALVLALLVVASAPCAVHGEIELPEEWLLLQVIIDSDVVALGRVADVVLERTPVDSGSGVTFVTIDPIVVVKGGMESGPVTFYLTECVKEGEFVERTIPPLPSFAQGDTFMVFLERDACGELADRLMASTEFKNGKASCPIALDTGIVRHSAENWLTLATILAEGQGVRGSAKAANVAVVGSIRSTEDVPGSRRLVELDVDRVIGAPDSWSMHGFMLPDRSHGFLPERPLLYPGPRDVPRLTEGDKIVAYLFRAECGVPPALLGGRNGVFLLDETGAMGCMSPRDDLAEYLPDELRGVATTWEYECHSIDELIRYFEEGRGD